MPDSKISPERESVAAVAPAEPADFHDWLAQARAENGDVPISRDSEKRWQRALRHAPLMLLIALLSATTGFAATTFLVDRTATVRGRLVDAENRPLVGAQVFLAANSEVQTFTNPQGEFRLAQVPPGRQALIVVREGAGEEYVVDAPAREQIDLGELVSRIRPLHLRHGSRAVGAELSADAPPVDQDRVRSGPNSP